jgi:hypothetical protein
MSPLVAMDVNRSCAYRKVMIRRRLTQRIFAVAAGYAFALHVLLMSLTPPVDLAGNDSSELAVICQTSSGAYDPAGQHQAPCGPDCLMAGCGMGGWTPPGSSTVANVAPAEIQILLPRPVETLGRATPRTPQVPRAPPHA